jgi:hypothetical protein
MQALLVEVMQFLTQTKVLLFNHAATKLKIWFRVNLQN